MNVLGWAVAGTAVVASPAWYSALVTESLSVGSALNRSVLCFLVCWALLSAFSLTLPPAPARVLYDAAGNVVDPVEMMRRILAEDAAGAQHPSTTPADGEAPAEVGAELAAETEQVDMFSTAAGEPPALVLPGESPEDGADDVSNAAAPTFSEPTEVLPPPPEMLAAGDPDELPPPPPAL